MPTPPAQSRSTLRRKRKFSQALFDRVCSNILDGSNTHPAIEKEGISKRQFYRHVSHDPILAEKFKVAQNQRDKVRNAKRIEEAEKELHRRAVEGWEEPVFDIKGNHCGNKRKYSDACLIFMLKSLKPEVFADKPHTLVQNNLAIATKSESEILASWRERLGATPEK
jgi:hypothetical protein